MSAAGSGGDAPAKAKPSARQWLGFLLQMLIGAAFGAGVALLVLKGGGQLAPVDAAKPLVLLVLVCSLVTAFPLHVIAHELGHALCGHWAGGTLLRVVIGPWRWERHKSGMRRRRVRSIKGIGGLAQTLLRPDERFRRSMTLMLLGGPLANLVIAALATAVIMLDAPWPLRVYCVGFVAFGALLGLMNLLPFRTAGFLTDGAHIRNLWTDPRALERLLRLTRLARASLDGLRPRDLDPADVYCIDIDQAQGAERLTGLWVRAAVALDQGDLAQARELLDAGMRDWNSFPDGFAQSLPLMLAEISAEHDRDPEQARQWLRRCEGGIYNDYQYLWLEACIAHLEGQTDARDQALTRTQAALGDTIYQADQRIYREKLTRLHAEIAAA